MRRVVPPFVDKLVGPGRHEVARASQIIVFGWVSGGSTRSASENLRGGVNPTCVFVSYRYPSRTNERERRERHRHTTHKSPAFGIAHVLLRAVALCSQNELWSAIHDMARTSKYNIYSDGYIPGNSTHSAAEKLRVGVVRRYVCRLSACSTVFAPLVRDRSRSQIRGSLL